MVVEEIGDLWALERAGVVSGLYHVLGGHLSPLDGIGPEQLNIGKLVERAVPPVKEVLLALNATVEGQSTAHYLTEQLQGHGVTVTPARAGRADRRRARLPRRGHAGRRHQEPAHDVARPRSDAVLSTCDIVGLIARAIARRTIGRSQPDETSHGRTRVESSNLVAGISSCRPPARLSASASALALWPFVDQMNPHRGTPPPRSDGGRSRSDPAGAGDPGPVAGLADFVRNRTRGEISRPANVLVRLPDRLARNAALPRANTRPMMPTGRTEAHDNWLVVVGLCTHLGCILKSSETGEDGANADEAWFCPCHAARFDVSGRRARRTALARTCRCRRISFSRPAGSASADCGEAQPRAARSIGTMDGQLPILISPRASKP